jgi:hypothetical protein
MDKNANRKIGAVGVMRTKAELLARGFDVAEPEVDCGVDVVAWDSELCVSRIQVKTTSNYCKKTGGARFQTSRMCWKTKRRDGYGASDVEFVVCYCMPANAFWVLPVSEVIGKVTLYLHEGDDHSEKWERISSNKARILGDKFKSIKQLVDTNRWLESQFEHAKARIDSLKKEIKHSDEREYNLYYWLTRYSGYKRRTIEQIARTGSRFNEEEWRAYYAANEERLDRDYSKFMIRGYEIARNACIEETNPADGAQRDSATGVLSVSTT